MISSADYWASVLAVALIVVTAYQVRRVNRQVANDRQRTRHAATVRQLGDGVRVVLSLDCAEPHPFRATVGESGRVYGFRTAASMTAWALFLIANADQLDAVDLDADAIHRGGVALHHPAGRMLRGANGVAKVSLVAPTATTTKEKHNA